MLVNFESMSNEELIELSRKINDFVRDRLRRQTFQRLAHFSIGDLVEFEDHQNQTLVGSIIKINRKSVNIQVLNPRKTWRVSPTLVRKLNASNSSKKSNVVPLFPR